MPSTNEPLEKTLQDVVEQVGRYPIEAFHFVQQGLGYTVERVHGSSNDPTVRRHISGQQLCQGLRDFALLRWGLMARAVLRKWNIEGTFDFGRIVFALVEHDMMQTTEDDRIEDFRDVFDFNSGLEAGYQISEAAPAKAGL